VLSRRRRVPPDLLALLVLLGCGVVWGVIEPARAEPLPRLRSDSVFNQEISGAPAHPDSASMIAAVVALGGFGFGRFQIDFSLQVVHAAPGSPTRTLVDVGDYYVPDCDPLGSVVPVPLDAAIEGQDGLSCETDNEDCHLLVVQGRTLYELYRANAVGEGEIEAQCLAVWQLDGTYPPEGRGEHCTSADAAGFPMAPLMFNADEIAAALALDATGGLDLGHAIRFVLPNARMANDPSLGGEGGRLYVRPASHAGSPSGPVGAIPYGSRLRLRADFPMAGYSPAARVILHTLQRYGMVLSDGGNVALTAESDRYTDTTWAELGIGSRVFDQTPNAADVTIGDFEVLDTGARIAETWECVRVDPDFGISEDGFESGDTSAWSENG
jgi:serine/threonine-protein kinase